MRVAFLPLFSLSGAAKVGRWKVLLDVNPISLENRRPRL